MPKFQIEQIAIAPRLTGGAQALLKAMGMTEWIHDTVTAHGNVFDRKGTTNTAELSFNYQSRNEEGATMELEILDYIDGDNWMRDQPACVSHWGMHCTEDELEEWRTFFARRGIEVAQEVFTQEHTNPYLISEQRKYHYTIFDTRSILGVDIKFIVRIDAVPVAAAEASS